ncbi:MAG: phosphate transport system regulatory protein PhoU [Oleiphilus sp.]|nr:MAG: phosphate transport system regulatory protein PhoU [Oleiphilus sp.]
MTTKESHTQHISQQFNQDLTELRNHILTMGGTVVKQLTDAVEALLEGDTQLAEDVRIKEEQVDEMERAIDEECTQIIALRQPAASDLRLVISTIKMVADLERIGDEASKIARLAIDLAEEGKSPRGYIEVRHISNHVVKMMNDALDTFARFDVDKALSIIKEDREVDAEYRSAIRSLMTFMMEDPRSISQVHNVMWVLRSLERVGDHTANLAEHTIYMVRGMDVRHMSMHDAEQALNS